MTFFGPTMYFDQHGHPRITVAEMAATEGMFSPAQCSHCDGIYDLGHVTVTARYADCSMWRSPCCGREVDDRTWKSFPDYERLGCRWRTAEST